MTESNKDVKRANTEMRPLDDVFKNFREEIETAMRTWSTSPWISSLFDYNGIRIPLCEIVDRRDRYELHVELPGMSKENVRVKAGSHSVEVSAQKSNLSEEKKRGRIYTERSESSFYRQIPLPEEIVPKKTKSKIRNGTLSVEIPKKNPQKLTKAANKTEVS